MKDNTLYALIAICVTVFGVFGLFTGETELTDAPRTETAKDRHTFDDLLDAIEWVESKGKAGAIGDGGDAVGAYQIHKIYVNDVNRIKELRRTDKYETVLQYKYRHRENAGLSRAMVKIYLRHYGGTFEEMARKHNGGPQGHKKESTKAYWLKVKARLERE